jgi:Na+-translocating ferredoxin:NAD+ oxidoreductase subunit G
MNLAPEVKSGLTLALIAGICTALVAATWQLTAGRIAANQQAWLEQSLAPALSGLFYDTGVTESVMTIPAPHDLPGNQDAIVYRVYAGDEPVAALFVVSARNGYAGPIRLLIGIDTEGTVSGVLVLDHRETPGLGDRIESGKSDWLLQFNGHSLTNPEPAGWAIKRDGGEFDQLTGASVTPRAIIKAIKTTLQYFDAHAGEIFATAADEPTEVEQ